MMASISVTPKLRAAVTTWSNIFWHAARSSSLPGIRAPHLDLAEARRAGAMPRAHHLFRLTLAAIGHAPERPVFASGDGHAGVPKLGGDAAVAGVLQHAHALAAADFPRDLAAELEVVALIVDGPTAVRLHVDAVAVHHLFERLLARLQAYVGHADHRQPRPAVGAHAAVG